MWWYVPGEEGWPVFTAPLYNVQKICDNKLTVEHNEIHSEHLTLSSNIGPDGIIYATFGGKITNDNVDVFEAWVRGLQSQIDILAAQKKFPILVYSDVSQVEHFERKPIKPLRELFAHDKQYEMKSAIVGATFFVAKLIDAIVEFTGRTDVRQFDTKKDALAWLLGAATPPKPSAPEK